MQHLLDIIQTLVGEIFLLFRYHKTCYVRFVNSTYCKPKLAKDFVMKIIVSNQDEIWNSVEIYDVYIEHGGQQYLKYYIAKYIYSSLLELQHY